MAFRKTNLTIKEAARQIVRIMEGSPVKVPPAERAAREKRIDQIMSGAPGELPEERLQD